MDPKNKLAPLFQAELELLEPDMVFSPSLDLTNEDGFLALINSLISDIVNMSRLVERVDKTKSELYETAIISNDDIVVMKSDILKHYDKVSKAQDTT